MVSLFKIPKEKPTQFVSNLPLPHRISICAQISYMPLMVYSALEKHPLQLHFQLVFVKAASGRNQFSPKSRPKPLLLLIHPFNPVTFHREVSLKSLTTSIYWVEMDAGLASADSPHFISRNWVFNLFVEDDAQIPPRQRWSACMAWPIVQPDRHSHWT